MKLAILTTTLLLPVALIAQTQIGADIDGEATGDFFGESVALSSDGTRMVVGAGRNQDNGTRSGHVRVFQENSEVWSQVGGDIDGISNDGLFGSSVAISADGTRIAVGGPGFNLNGVSAGYVRVFEETSGVWTQVGGDIIGENIDDLFGSSIAMSADGSRISVGATSNDGNGMNSGHVRVLQENSGVWSQVGGDIDGEAAEDFFGWSIAMTADGSRIVVGAIENDGNGSRSGHVRVFQENSGLWSQIGGDIDGEAADDLFGRSVAISADGSRIAVGAILNSDNGTHTGHARIFQESSGVWLQVGDDIDGENTGGLFGGWSGESIAMSSDGSKVIIGAPRNDGNGSNSGHARVFEETSGGWTQIGDDIDGEASGDQSGSSVAISRDGNRIAVGAIGNTSFTGHVRVFSAPTLPSRVFIGLTGYPDLDSAVQAADNGDVIRVTPGTYMENFDLMGKEVTIEIGETPE